MTAIWVAFEGGEGTGKSTQAERLAARLGAVLTREPGGTAIGNRLRQVLLDTTFAELDARTEALLMAADRAQHVREVVRPALVAGRPVVSDRSAFSSLAYQGYGRGLPIDEVRELSEWATEGLWPDVVVLLDVPPRVQAERMHREHDRLESAGTEFHDRVRRGFAELAAHDPDRWLRVDGAKSVDDVAADVAASIDGWTSANAG